MYFLATSVAVIAKEEGISTKNTTYFLCFLHYTFIYIYICVCVCVIVLLLCMYIVSGVPLIFRFSASHKLMLVKTILRYFLDSGV